MAERERGAEAQNGDQEEQNGDGYARRIYEKLERDERLNYERIKIQDEIRQTVLSWGVAALAAIGAFLSGAAYLSYDRVINSIAETIEQSLDSKVQAALDEKLTEANRQMEDVFRRSEDLLSREIEDVRESKKQVEATVIDARSAIASLEAQTDFVRGAAVKASDAAVDATRAAVGSQTRVAEIDETVATIRARLEERAAEFEAALERAEQIQTSIREAIRKLNDERVSTSADVARVAGRLAVLEAKIAGLNGSLETAIVDALQAEGARLTAVQDLKIVFYVSRWNAGADIKRVLALHDGLVAKGVPNDPYATEDNTSFEAIAAEIDGDFTGVRRHLEGDRFQLFAAPSARPAVESLIEMLREIDPGAEISAVFEEFVVDDPKYLERERGAAARPDQVVLITKTPPRTF